MQDLGHYQILGMGCKSPSAMVVCWTPDGSTGITTARTGGTGQALRIAFAHGVPIFNGSGKTIENVGRGDQVIIEAEAKVELDKYELESAQALIHKFVEQNIS